MKNIIVCVNYRANPDQPSCAARGSEAIARCIEQEIARRELPLSVERVICLGCCRQGPNVRLAPDGRFFHHFNTGDIAQLLSEADCDPQR